MVMTEKLLDNHKYVYGYIGLFRDSYYNDADYQIYLLGAMIETDVNGKYYLILNTEKAWSTDLDTDWIRQRHEKYGNMEVVYDLESGEYCEVDEVINFEKNCIMLKISGRIKEINWED